MKLAIIDVGSNSIKFLLRDGDSILADENNICRLGEGLHDTGMLSEDAMERGTAVISGFAARAREIGADIYCVGTMALRRAGNTAQFKKLVQQQAGVELRVIQGEEEARLAYLAVLSAMPDISGPMCIFDTGGGSTEFVFGMGTSLKKRFSVDIGSIRVTEKYFTGEAQVQNALDDIRSAFLAAGVSVEQTPALVGMGGTLTSMGAVMHKMEKYDPAIIQGSKLTLDDVDAQIQMYASMSVEQRKSITGLQPKRAEVILAGACIVKAIMSLTGTAELTISDRGLRHGLAFDLSQN
jgi:exopolyphosphatase/guanosine-5'-triphosphate,3'-diphosphate pyrophosphatase